MKIEYTDLAKDYIEKHGIKDLYLMLWTTSSCSVHFRTLVKEGKPEKMEAFIDLGLDPVNVYIDKALPPMDEVKIGFQKFARQELLILGDDRID